MIYLAENLKALRKGRDWTQEEAAERLSVSPQSVSKWERGETMPDISLLPALANLYGVSVDALLGMDRINSARARNEVFTKSLAHSRMKEYGESAAVLCEAMKTFPNDESFMSELAMSLALEGSNEGIARAIELCEQVLAGRQNEKVHHTTRAALSFIYMKAGDKDRALRIAKNLPHMREGREAICGVLDRNPIAEEIDEYLRYIDLGEAAGAAPL